MTDRRAVSTLVGVVLLFGLVVVASVGVLLLGGAVQDDTEQRSETARVEQSFLELGRDLDSLARSEERTRVIDLDLPDDGDAAVREEASGRIWVNRTNFSASRTDVLVNRSIGSIRYEGREATVAYQAGAVFEQTGNRTRVLSNPGFQYTLTSERTRPTLTIPLVTTVGPDSLPNGEVRAEKVASTSPINDETIVENDLVSVTVQSDWYVGWAQYFRSLAAKTGTADTAVTVDHARRTATIELIVPVQRRAVKGGVVSGSTAGTLTIANNINVTSYNSTKCSFSCSEIADSSVFAAGNLTIENNINVGGDVEVGRTFTIDGDPSIDGNASYEQIVVNHPSKGPGDYVDGWYNNNSSVRGYEAVDNVIDAKVNQFRSDNDNDEPGVPINASDRLDCSGSCELQSGVYYLEAIRSGDLKGVDFTLNASEGQITIAVNGSVAFDNVNASVEGSNRVNVFVDSTKTGTDCDKSDQDACDFDFHQSSLIVENATGARTDNAARMWLYMDSESDGVLRGGAGPAAPTSLFTGVIFAPGDDDDPGANVSTYNKGTVQGAVVGNVTAAANNGELRYDRRLRNTETIVTSTAVPRLTFLIVSAYEVAVDER